MLSCKRQLGEEHSSQRDTFKLFCHKGESLTKTLAYISNYLLSPPSGCPSGSSNSMCLQFLSCSAPAPRPPGSTYVTSATISIITWTDILELCAPGSQVVLMASTRALPSSLPPLESRPWVIERPPHRPSCLQLLWLLPTCGQSASFSSALT